MMEMFSKKQTCHTDYFSAFSGKLLKGTISTADNSITVTPYYEKFNTILKIVNNVQRLIKKIV